MVDPQKAKPNKFNHSSPVRLNDHFLSLTINIQPSLLISLTEKLTTEIDNHANKKIDIRRK